MALALILVVVIAWPIWLAWHTDASMSRVDALTGGPKSKGTTYLFVGSDSRDGLDNGDPTEGARSDSSLLVHRAPNGQTSMISLPRDAYVEIPGYGWDKFNAALAIGGPALMVETTEQLTGLRVDHYVEIGLLGVGTIVDALGGVNLCWDSDVDDEFSGMQWSAGCHDVDGTQALSFVRMRYADPTGDVGRTLRQRQLLGQISKKTFRWQTFLNPLEQLRLGDAAADALTVGQNTHIWNVASLLVAMRSATDSGLVGMPPIANPDGWADVGSVILLDEPRCAEFFSKMRAGTLTESDFAQSWQ